MTSRPSLTWLGPSAVFLALLQLQAAAYGQGLPDVAVPKAPSAPAAPKPPATPAAPAAPGAPKEAAAPAPTAPAADAPAEDAPEEEEQGIPGAPPAGGGLSGEEGDVPTTESSVKFTDRLPPELWSRSAQDQATREQQEQSSELTMQQIINPQVVTASNSAESSLSAPAWVITITRQDLIDRGYGELSEVLDDLPSMDVVRPYGDTYLKNYWRGYRNNIGSPFLLMIDGVIFNQLWLNEVWIMTTFPVTNIDRIEVLYGPASAIYGPNAAMGVINVITRKDVTDEGAHTTTRFTLGTPTDLSFRNMSKVADGQMLYKGDGYRVSASARLESSVLDPSMGENFEYTKTRYYRDPSLWGMAANYPELAEGFRSPEDKLGVDVRLFLGQHPSCTSPSLANSTGLGRCTELAVQHFEMTTGYGTVYPADIAQTSAPWTYLDQSAYIRHSHDLSTHLSSQSMLRYRISNIDQPSFFLERSATNAITGSYWESTNNSWTFTQDFSINAGRRVILSDDQLGFSVGFKYERLDLDRAYLLSLLTVPAMGPGGLAYPGGSPDAFPVPPDGQPHVQNRSQIDTAGTYLLTRYRFLTDHNLHLGVRLDYSEQLNETEPIFRAGYVGQMSRELTVKLLYGQAFQTPPFRELFGVTSGPVSGSSASLRSERSQTLEASADYALDFIGARAGGYFVSYDDPMVSGPAGVTNVDSRRVVGLDVGLNFLIPIDFMRRLKAWMYYSPIVLAEQSVPAGTPTSATDPTPVAAGTVAEVGDLARHKVLFGITGEVNKYFLATIMGRFIGPRDTVPSNPIDEADAFLVLDANIMVRDVFATGLSLSLRGTNLFDSTYFHPGIRTANSGDTPGEWDGATWVGSQGSYNSLMPQPGREIYLSLGLDL